MRPDLMEILVCPVCRGELDLTIAESNAANGEIVEGALHCPHCTETYPPKHRT